MSDPRHEPFNGLAALYAAGALSDAERTSFETHLEVCHECVDEARALMPVTQALVYAAHPLDPPPALRARVLHQILGTVPAPSSIHAGSTISVDAPMMAPEESDAATSDADSTRRGLGAPFWLAASLVIGAAGGGGWYVAELDHQIVELQKELDVTAAQTELMRLQAAVARAASSERDAVLAIVTGPDARQINLVGQPLAPRAEARVVWSETTDMVFLASGLPPLPAGDIYQLWFVLPDAPVGAALLAPDADGSATLTVEIPDAVALPATMAITVEPAGGVPAPTGDVYLLGQAAK